MCMSCVPRNGYENIQPRDAEIQLNGLLEAYGMSKVSTPADGDCFFPLFPFIYLKFFNRERTLTLRNDWKHLV